MTFRPSDDVLEDMENGQQVSSTSTDQYNIWGQDWESHLFHREDDSEDQVVSSEPENNTKIDIPVWEEVKAPDLSELLQNSWWLDNDSNEIISQYQNNEEKPLVPEQSTEIKEIENDSNNQNLEIHTENNLEESQVQTESQEDYIDSNKLPDSERAKIVSSIEWWINSNLDFLVDKEWLNIVEKYKKVNRFVFRWWIFTISILLWIISWIVLQVKAGNASNIDMINDSMIENKNRWVEDTSDKILSPLVDSGVWVDIIIPYWSASIEWNNFQSKSNLISYKWIILPQLASINYKSDEFISMEDFDNQKVWRDGLKKLINLLIKNNSIYKNTSNLKNVSDSKWNGNFFEWSLVEGFNLSCLDNNKRSDLVCDRFIETFYNYGKYYQISSNTPTHNYSSEILWLTKNLRNNGKDIQPVCKMIKDYVLHAGMTSDDLSTAMSYCFVDDNNYYKKLINFVELENSLWQPELSDKVFEDPDLNAYKLLSALQSVEKFLWWTSFNENYIKSYLNYVQKLIDKDRGNNKHISPLYKGLMYVFNSDELYPFLIKNSYTNLKLQIDQINNWNKLYGNESLIEQLKAAGLTGLINTGDSNYTELVIEQRSIEDLFSQYYAMTNRLKIRKSTPISDEKLRVLTELIDEKVLNKTDGESLKLTLVLHRKNNTLYVDSAKIANQPKFSEIISIYIKEWNISFQELLSYIDEQAWMWYELEPEETEPQPTFCEEMQENEDISVYTCDDTTISLYKWDVEYNFTLVNWILNSYTISDEKLEKAIKDKLNWVMFMKDNTQTIITSIIDFEVGAADDDNIQNKLYIIDQFRIHFKLVPEVHDIKWNADEFLITLTLWDFTLQGNYNINTHLLTKVSYVACGKTLEIRWLTISITTENEPQLIEIKNNPKAFLTQINPAAYKKYQKMCDEPKEPEKKK